MRWRSTTRVIMRIPESQFYTWAGFWTWCRILKSTRSIVSAKWALANKTRLIISAWRTVHSNRFQRHRMKNRHNFKSKKSRIYLWGVKLQDKVRSIFVRYEIFENIRGTQRNDKGKRKHPFANPLCLTGIFENSVPNNHEYFGLYDVTLLPINRFWNFWT